MFKRYLVLVLIVFLFACAHSKPPAGGGIGDSPPVFLKGGSYDYCALNPSKDYKPFINMLNSYKINMLRTFAYCGWDEGFFPWSGYMGDLKPESVQRMQDFVSYANSKGIWVILSLFQDNAGGGTEKIISKNREELATYIARLVQALEGKGVIFETINENPDRKFQEWVLSELRKYGVRTSTYEVVIGSDYDSHHLSIRNWGGKPGWTGYIHSTDTPKLRYLNDDDLKRIATEAKEKGGHIEFLFYWGRNGRELNSPRDITDEYGRVLEFLRDMN